MTTLTLVLLVFGVSALTTAGLCLGLWLGERGRRTDLARLAGVQYGAPPPATVLQTPDAEADAIALISAEGVAKMTADLMAEGLSERDAKAEARRILDEAARLGAEW